MRRSALENRIASLSMSGDAREPSSSSESTTSALSWIAWFCSLPAHEYFCEIREEFLEDEFNLTGLGNIVPFYREAMEMILDLEPDEDSFRVPDVSILESSAELLYGLAHQRYIITKQGLQAMYAKYEQGHFGTCPRALCNGQKLLPCGKHDLLGVDSVKLFCPNCIDIYTPPSSRFLRVDGAFFGTTFPHLFFQSYPQLLPFTQPVDPANAVPVQVGGESIYSAAPVYTPRIFGFRISESSLVGPRKQWLRMRPLDPKKLESATVSTPEPDIRPVDRTKPKHIVGTSEF